MADFDLVIRGGKIATASDTFHADIGIKDGKIAALANYLAKGSVELDAKGKIVAPGGIDAHCHLDQPMTDGTVMADGFESGTKSAAYGGTTTIIPFACQMRGHTLRDAVQDYHSRSDGEAYIDYAFHLIVSDISGSVANQELPALIDDGYTSFKIYMTYDDLKLDDREILEVLTTAREHGGMAMIHAENADCIEWLTEKLLQAGKTQPQYHWHSRPPIVEREATHRALSLAELVGVPVLIVHVSGEEAIKQIRDAQARGLQVYGETCPQYLFLTAEDLGIDDFHGAKCICSPPPRDESNQEAVWLGLETGVFQVFSSDHAPFSFNDPKGKLIRGEETPFPYIPNGIPGLETRLPLLFSEGVNKGRITLPQFVALTATSPAQIYGLYPRKGTVSIGADADLTIWDPYKEVTIQNENLHHNVDYTPYEGMDVKGWPATTISRGEIIVQDGELLVQKGRGAFLRCERPKPAQPNQHMKSFVPGVNASSNFAEPRY